MIFVTVSTGHFDPLIEECTRLSDRYEFFGQIGITHFEPPFPHVRQLSPLELEEKMKRAELVISHAGTGMLSWLYRLQKRAVVVPKQIRYGESNDGQVELAKKWAELGCAVLCMDVKNLAPSIERARIQDFKFPKLPPLGAFFNERVFSFTTADTLSSKTAS